MHFNRRLLSFNVDSPSEEKCFTRFIKLVLTFSFIGWFWSLSLKNKNFLQGILKVCGKSAGVIMNALHETYKVWTLKKSQWILADPSQPLFNKFMLLPSRCRYILPKCRTNRHIGLYFCKSWCIADTDLSSGCREHKLVNQTQW